MLSRLCFAALCVVSMTSCAPEKPEDIDFCGSNLNAAELKLVGPPTSDFGNGNIGLYSAQEGDVQAKFSLLNCKTAKFTQIQSRGGLSDLKNLVTQAVAKGEMSTVESFTKSMRSQNSLTVIEAAAVRNEVSRHGCGCIVFYSHDWYSEFPKEFVRGKIEVDAIPTEQLQ